jgi:tRNA (uracil-5-)-methyltransferase TRM9
MDDATIRRLNDLNREFYRTTAGSFDESRRHAWPGWERLLPYLKLPLSVLDIGCGNGRFGLFLAVRLGADIRYHGIDSNPALLERARQSLTTTGLTISLERRDIVENPPDSGVYDLVVLFGVLHHIPGNTQRQDFMRALARRVTPGGLLAFACWRFHEYARFQTRTVPWPDGFDVEPGDFLLDWRRGTPALRYCHYIDDAEHNALVAATGMAEVATYRADGDTGDINCYSILRSTPPG